MPSIYKNDDVKHKELSTRIIGVFFDVYSELGYGFPEKIYRTAMAKALASIKIQVEEELWFPVWFRAEKIGKFRFDLVADAAVILELKAANAIAEEHVAQLVSYLRASPWEVGYVLNFGPKPSFKRMVFSNNRKGYPFNVPLEQLNS